MDTITNEERYFEPAWNLIWNGRIPNKINGVPRTFNIRSYVVENDGKWSLPGQSNRKRLRPPYFIRMMGRDAREFTTHIGGSVEKLVQIPDKKNPKKTHKFYKRVYCDECGGIVRYQANGFTVCRVCGLVHNERVFFTNARAIRKSDLHGIEYGDFYDQDPDN